MRDLALSSEATAELAFHGTSATGFLLFEVRMVQELRLVMRQPCWESQQAEGLWGRSKD